MIIGVDFDGTVVEHRYPDIGKEADNAFVYLRRLQELGAKIVLFTMRSGRELDEAVRFMEKHGVVFYGVNTNPTQRSWTTSPKAYCDVYVDDAGIGVPVKSPHKAGRPVVDWDIVGPALIREVKIRSVRNWFCLDSFAIYVTNSRDGWKFTDLGRGITDEVFTTSACGLIDSALKTSGTLLDEDNGFVLEFGSYDYDKTGKFTLVLHEEAPIGEFNYLTTGKLYEDEETADHLFQVSLCPAIFKYFQWTPSSLWFKLHSCKT